MCEGIRGRLRVLPGKWGSSCVRGGRGSYSGGGGGVTVKRMLFEFAEMRLRNTCFFPLRLVTFFVMCASRARG